MRWLVVLLFLAVPSGAAATCGPPCGYILPTLDIVIDDKPACGGARIIFADEPPEDCYDLLGPDETRIIPAMLHWEWEASEEGTYPKEPQKDIEISFSGASTNPRWIDVSVTGDGMVDGRFIIDDAELFDPDNFEERPNGDTPAIWYSYQRPIDIVLTRTGDPSARDIDIIDASNGVVKVFVKSESSESSARFRASFGIEELRFMACADAAIGQQADICPQTASDADAPLPLAWALMALLAARRARSGRHA